MGPKQPSETMATAVTLPQLSIRLLSAKHMTVFPAFHPKHFLMQKQTLSEDIIIKIDLPPMKIFNLLHPVTVNLDPKYLST
jgi:hypothetical protein